MDLDPGGGVAIKSPTDGREPSHPPPAVTVDSTSCPRLVLLPCYAERTDDISDDQATTTSVSVSSCTSTGRRFRLSFGLVPSPGISSFCYAWEDQDPRAGDDDHRGQCPILLAAHRDCLLLEVTTPSTYSTVSSSPLRDYFLCQASAAGRRPPSLMLLPPCYIPKYYDRRRGGASQSKARCMLDSETAVLRRGKDGEDILVAQLEQPEKEAGELCLFHPGRDSEWHLKKMPIVYEDQCSSRDNDCQQAHQEYDDNPMQWWSTDTAFTVGDRFLCWVDYLRGLLFIVMAVDDEASLRLCYKPLPVEQPSGNPRAGMFGRSNMRWTRNLAAAGDGSVRFVDVESRCCCGEPGRTSCERGRFLFTVTTWTLKLSVDEHELMEWVNDGVLDCDEIWAQPGYPGLPRVTVEYPIVVDFEDPDAVCFVVRTDYRSYGMESVDKKVWTIVVDTRQKVLRSVVPFIGSDLHHPSSSIFPAKIQY